MMAKAGLQALADAYGIERTQQKEFRLLGERFFEQLRDSLTPLLAHAVKLLDLSQSLTSFAAFCAGDPAQHTLIFGQADRPRFAFRIEGGLARVFLDSLLGNSLTPAAEDGSTPAAMTPTEIRMITQVLIDVLLNVAPRILDSLSSAPQLTVSATRNQAGLIPETFPASEPFLAAVGSFTMNGRQGAMAFGLPLAEGLRITSKALATQPPPDIQRDRAKARALLAEAVVPLAAVLGTVTLPLSLINNLAPGAVIPLGRLQGSVPSVELRAAGHTLFSGTVVADRGWYRFLLQQGEKCGG